MRSNYLRVMEKPRVARRAMADFMTRAAVDGRVEQLIKKHEGERIDELSAFALVAGIDAYVSLKTFDAVLQGMINKYEQKNDGGAKYEKTYT